MAITYNTKSKKIESKMKFLNKSLNLQLVTSFYLLSLVTVSSVAIGAYNLGKQSLKESIFARLNVASSIKEEQIGEWLDNQYRDVFLSAQLPELREQAQILLNTKNDSEKLKDKQLAREVLSQYFSNLLNIKSDMREISILSKNSIVAFSTNKDTIGKYRPIGWTTTYFTADYFESNGKNIKPTFYTSTITGKPELSLATPIFDRNDRPVGVILIALNLEKIDNLIRQRTGLGKTGETYLVSRLREKNAFISSEQTSESSQRVSSSAIEAATAGKNGAGLYENYNGVPVIGVYRWLEGRNLALLTEISQEEAFDPAQKLARNIFLIGLSVSGMVLVGVIFVSRRITKPILALTEAATKVNSGNLNYQASVRREDEIGLLASSFNQMGQRLRKSFIILKKVNQELEKRVAQRTRELKKAKEAAEAASRAKDLFLVNISHELRTPLNSILGYSRNIQHAQNLESDQVLGLRIIEQSGSHLLTLINDILDFSKSKVGKMKLSPSNLYLPKFLEDIAATQNLRAQEKDILFKYEIVGSLPEAIILDEKRLRQVLLNLLSNAVKFTNSGIVTFRVSAIGEKIESGQLLPQQQLRFEVIDTGVGISSSVLEKIFLPFEQAGDLSTHSEGTGLGLSISKQLIELMGSKIHVKSQLGSGSTFWFDLAVDVVDLEEQPNPQSQENKRILGYKGDVRRILIVDDRKENRELLFLILQSLGFKVEEAINGQEGLQVARSLQPDLILTDLLMPVKTGLKMVAELRQIPEFREIPIIGVSASTFEIMEEKSLGVGCDAFLSKPIDELELLNLLQQYLHLEWAYNLPEQVREQHFN